MKKLIFTLVAVLMAATETFAQDVYVATLNHEGTITEYYGASAFQNAYNAAAGGDIITLSEGVFTLTPPWGTSAVTISKAVTVRGVGMDNDNGNPTTTISGYLYLQGSGMSFEGIIFRYAYFDNVADATFLKCLFFGNSSENISNLSYVSNSTFTNCIFPSRTRAYSCNNVFFNNCYLYIFSYFRNATFFNCFLNINAASNNSTEDCNFTNCIIANTMNLFASNKAANCVGISTNTSNTTNIFKNIPECLNCTMTTKSVFNSWDDAISSTNITPESFELGEEGILYQGIDGTQIGMLGGNYPYNPVVSIPRITRCEVAEKATADGKLSVNIEVTAPTTK